MSSLTEYLSKEPSPVERIEYAIAQGSAIYINANRGKGGTAKKVNDLMLFSDAWKPEDEEGVATPASFAASAGARRKRG